MFLEEAADKLWDQVGTKQQKKKTFFPWNCGESYSAPFF